MKVTGKVTKTEGLLLAMAAVFLCVLLQLRLSAPEPVEAAGCVITTSRAAEEPVTPEPTPPVDVNTADVDELDTLYGIGPALAQRIIDYREANGPFETVDELMEVSGIGEAKLADLRDRATVEDKGVTEHEDTDG